MNVPAVVGTGAREAIDMDAHNEALRRYDQLYGHRKAKAVTLHVVVGAIVGVALGLVVALISGLA
jgi:hypothetical protein